MTISDDAPTDDQDRDSPPPPPPPSAPSSPHPPVPSPPAPWPPAPSPLYPPPPSALYPAPLYPSALDPTPRSPSSPSTNGYGAAPSGPLDVLGRPMAAWWQRLVAVIIDFLILAVPNSIVIRLIAGSSLSTGATSPGHVGPPVWEAIGVAVVITLGYFSFLDGGRSGQTVGKMALGVSVRDIDTGGPIGAGRALMRRFIFIATYFGLILFVINALSPLWDRRRQAWHDRIVRSCVVSIR